MAGEFARKTRRSHSVRSQSGRNAGAVTRLFDRDLWPVVEQPPGALRVHLLIAAHSDSYSAADREHALAIAKSNPQITADILPGGHWLHADNPDGVLTKVVKYLT